MTEQKRYKVASGLGGVFTVIILEELEGDRVRVRCLDKGWEELVFTPKMESLTELPVGDWRRIGE